MSAGNEIRRILQHGYVQSNVTYERFIKGKFTLSQSITLVISPSRWYDVFPILHIFFQTVWGHSEPISAGVPHQHGHFGWIIFRHILCLPKLCCISKIISKKMLIFKGSATNRSQNIVWIIFMPLIPVSDVSEEQIFDNRR